MQAPLEIPGATWSTTAPWGGAFREVRIAPVPGPAPSAAGDPCLPDLRASDDTYKGFTSGNDLVADYGGTADRLDLRPLESSDVYFNAFDEDSSGSNDSLRIVINDSTRVDVIGHFAPSPNRALENGRMEQIVFSDKVITTG